MLLKNWDASRLTCTLFNNSVSTAGILSVKRDGRIIIYGEIARPLSKSLSGT
jgi:hypothetical protein